jgi:hypothetical protein
MRRKRRKHRRSLGRVFRRGFAPNPKRRGPNPRAAFLMRWFLSVYEGRRAPYPKRAFGAVARHMHRYLKRRRR